MPSEEQIQFNAAMARFERNPIYRRTKQVVSVVVVSLQLLMGWLLLRHSVGFVAQLYALPIGYVLADFVNGWVHLYMDNATNYASPTGPFYASFHLHHRTPKYRHRPLLVVYYVESGSKLWLAIVEILMVIGIWQGALANVFGYIGFYFVVFSCLSEVSHYLCHVPRTPLVRFLGEVKLLLPSHYHARHHREDNVQYAFLNGMTDPLLDWIARRYYGGYKTTTDTHYAYYAGADTDNR